MSRIKYQASDFSKNTNPDLPFDIISDILSRLSVKPLLRFKSVSKTWYALVENPHFIKKHCAMSKQNITLNSLLVTEIRPRIRGRIYQAPNKFSRVHYPKTYSMWLEYKNNKTVNLGHNFSFEKYYPRVLDICDGLVCFTLKNSEIFICNPTTRRIREILGYSLLKGEQLCEILGFVFHDNEYKLLRIVGFRAEVYSMSTNIWREIEVNTRNIDTSVCIYAGMPVTINEVFYWSNPTKGGCVVSFDMNGYNFSTIDFPEDISMGTFSTNWQIHDVNGKLVVTISIYQWFKMWVLNEKERSWTMKLKIDDLPFIGRMLNLLGCELNGNLIMQHITPDRDIVLLSYDPESHKITYLSFQGLKQRQAVYMFTESLLLV